MNGNKNRSYFAADDQPGYDNIGSLYPRPVSVGDEDAAEGNAYSKLSHRDSDHGESLKEYQNLREEGAVTYDNAAFSASEQVS